VTAANQPRGRDANEKAKEKITRKAPLLSGAATLTERRYKLKTTATLSHLNTDLYLPTKTHHALFALTLASHLIVQHYTGLRKLLMKTLSQTINALAIAFLTASVTASGNFTPPSYVFAPNAPFFLPAPTADSTTGWQIKNFGPVGIGIKIKSP
jgi:hypothetical protein